MCDARWVPLRGASDADDADLYSSTRRHLLALAAAFIIAPLLAPAASALDRAPCVCLRTIPVEESAQLANSGGSNRAAE